MKVSRLISFLTGAIEADIFEKEIRKEVSQHQIELQGTGSSAAVFLEGRCQHVITSQHIRNICHHYSQEKIPFSHFRYILDAIQLYDGFTFASDELEDIVFSIYDEETNSPPTPSEIIKLNQELMLLGCD